MRGCWVTSAVVFFSILLCGCMAQRNPCPNADPTIERWQPYVNINPDRWANGADVWFFTGAPNSTEIANRHTPSTVNRKLNFSNFINVVVNGFFQVQIVGTSGVNTVTVNGPREAVQEVVMSVRNNTLYLEQTKDAPDNINRVIVHVGIGNLHNLVQWGRGTIEGRQIKSTDLYVTSRWSGNIYLAGNVSLRRVIAAGSGAVNVFAATTPSLDIKTLGSGAVNVSGDLGIRSIIHHGTADINIIGANANHGVRIYADGKGKIGINGRINLQQVTAKDYTRIYIYYVNSPRLYAHAAERSAIGLAGKVDELHVSTYGFANFQGRYLCTQEAYVRAHDGSHINVMASNKTFALSTGHSSVYYFGPARLLTSYVHDSSTVLPLWFDKPRPNCMGDVWVD